jgi:hypothetical protein
VSDRERRADEAEGGCCETISSSATVRRSVRLRSMATARSVGMAIRPAAAGVLTALFTRPPRTSSAERPRAASTKRMTLRARPQARHR